MEVLHNINLDSLADTSVSLMAAFIFGGLIGLERQFRQRTAGLRTNVLVAVGAAIFVDAGNRLTGHDGKRGMCVALIPRQRCGLLAPSALVLALI
jgi:putative Mg2+ transporter-C (MgtC) family protein